jgi:hypothetical protein
MTLHVPFVGFLRVQDFLEGLAAQSLCGSEIRMARARDIPGGPLSDGNPSSKEQATKNSSENSVFDHS